MDKITERLASFGTTVRREHLTPEAVHATQKLLLDTLGCAVGGYRSEPAQIARRLAARSSGKPPARVLGTDELTSLEAAAFANCVMARYLDYNDTFMSQEVAHPSDMIPAILAVGDAYHASGEQVLLAVATAYEMFAIFADTCSLWDKGWDHGLYIGLGVAVGAGQLLQLTKEQMGNAIALTVTANVPTRQTRSGALTMWKGCAAAAAARAGIYAAELAKEGMTGPSAAFEGRHGVCEQVTGPLELGAFGGNGKPFAVERSGIKFFPTEYNSQVPLDLILKLREKVGVDEIEAVHVETYHFTFTEIGSEPEKWRPTTRETADHSLPYMLAAALSDGGISVASFSEERIRDPKLPPLMDRIRISENLEFTKKFPASGECRIEITTKKGERYVEQGSYPKGHAKNPMTDAEVERKFRTLCHGLLSQDRCDAIVKTVSALDEVRDVGELLAWIQIKEE
jgi:2-methylcitrate dehydratase